MSFQTMSIKKFREAVESIEDDKTRIMIKVSYLTASRASELLTQCCQSELLNGRTRPYGLFLTYKIQDYELTPAEDPTLKNKITEKVFVITAAVAKRGKRIKHQNTQNKPEPEVTPDDIKEALTRYNQPKLQQKWEKGEITLNPKLIQALNSRITIKAIALPINIEYEPWTYDLLKYYQQEKKLSFDYTRQSFHKFYRQALTKILPPKNIHSIKNPLRHYRISHLIEYYQFDAVQVSNYSGWTMQTAFAMQGMKASNNLDFYTHLAWRQYFPKLLRPIDQFK